MVYTRLENQIQEDSRPQSTYIHIVYKNGWGQEWLSMYQIFWHSERTGNKMTLENFDNNMQNLFSYQRKAGYEKLCIIHFVKWNDVYCFNASGKGIPLKNEEIVLILTVLNCCTFFRISIHYVLLQI